jgi:hypothetical protein
MLSQLHMLYMSNGMTNKLRKTWKKAADLLTVTEEKHEQLQSAQAVFGPRIEPETYRIRSAVATSVCSSAF